MVMEVIRLLLGNKEGWDKEIGWVSPRPNRNAFLFDLFPGRATSCEISICGKWSKVSGRISTSKLYFDPPIASSACA